jgi:predicted alpha/beta superfamily hydrolase
MKNLTRIIFAVALHLVFTPIKSQTTEVISGKIDRVEKFQSKFVTPRNVDIWLPDGYSDSTKYAVLYMHDGKMLFDPKNSWNKQSWNVDDVATALFTMKKTKQFIVVGIWNDEQTRIKDYFPQKPIESLSTIEIDKASAQLQQAGFIKEKFNPQSDNYLQFIVQELKPYIDKKYSVYTNRKNTFIAGSSLGALISIYAICEYPTIFGGAACLSTHWVGTLSVQNNPIPNAFIAYLDKNLPRPKNHRIYFDCGDQTLDAMYPPIQKRVDSLMLAKGYTDTNWLTRYFPGDDHSERYWSRRLNIPLEFIFRNSNTFSTSKQ